MTPESIVVSLEHAKALKKAGWPQESTVMAWWICEPESDSFVGTRRESLPESDPDAPTAEEILRRLPNTIPSRIHKGGDMRLTIVRFDTEWSLRYENKKVPEPHFMFHDVPLLADAAAAMYCYLAEQKLLPNPL